LFSLEFRRELWLTKKNARIHRVLARHNPAANTVALPAKEPDRLSSWIATADTTAVRETSRNRKLLPQKGAKDTKVNGRPLILFVLFALFVVLRGLNRH
jgi:hypothetical protein